MLDTLSLKLEYMSHWVAFERLQKDLAAVLKAHGVSLETVVTSCVKSRTAASVSDGECGASAYVSVRSCAGRAGSSGLFRSVIDVFAEELCLESNVFELDLFKEEYQWIHDQLAGISTKFLSVAQFQQLYEVLDLVNHDGLVEFLETGHCEEGQHEELRDKNQLACTAIKEIALIADGQVTHDQQEALYQLQSFARFINTKITAALDCSLEHTEEDVDADWLSDDSDSVALSTESDADRKKRRKDALARGKPGEPARRPMRIAPKYKRSLSV